MLREIWAELPTQVRVGVGLIFLGGLAAQLQMGLIIAYAIGSSGCFLFFHSAVQSRKG